MRATIACALVVLAVSSARAEEPDRFEIDAKIYTKWLYRNNDRAGVVSLGNPFWPDNISGDNGVASELELNLIGRVSKHVQAGARIQSRFGNMWQDWWENGDIAYDQENTSGESLGMNRASYMKLRGYWILAELPLPLVESVLVGASDFAMFNPWTIGKIRYIDRDNGKGIFVKGHVVDDLSYLAAVIALPKLWVGPNWSTGVGDPLARIPFYSQDWAYALKLEATALDGVRLTAIGTLTRDSEIDLTDPDAVGSDYPTCQDELGNAIPGCERDGAVDWTDRYTNFVGTLEAQIDRWEGGSINVIGGVSYQSINPDVTGNGVALNNGVFPLVWDPDMWGYFVRARGEIFDVFIDDLSLKLEYFDIGEHFQTIFGARREADVLLTDGFLEGGQVPTLNSANEFVDFDEAWYETVIGWRGGTAVLAYAGDVELALEQTVITYDTNAQDRDVATKYPDFLHVDGMTDTDLYDYANVYDRGRDPRSVYHRDQDRLTSISVLSGLWRTGVGAGLDLGWKLKLIVDDDARSHTTTSDDYLGLITTGRVWLGWNAGDGLKLTFGTQLDWWDEENRRGTLEQGYGDDTTLKVRPWLDLAYTYEGFALRYRLEYLHKDARRERDDDRMFEVIRSKASLEVAW